MAVIGAGLVGRACAWQLVRRGHEVLLLDPLQNLARLEDFPMIDRPQVCRRCNFRRLCFP